MAKTRKKVKKKIVKDKKKSDKIIKPEKSPEPKPEITPHPTAGPKVQEFEDLLDRQLAGEKPKRPVGRPPKEKTDEPEQPELTIEIVAGVIKIPFELWSISQSVKSLALSDEEAKRIAEPARQLLEYYLPQIPVIAYAWVGMSVSIFWIMQTRLRTIQEIKKQRERISQGSPQPVTKSEGTGIKSFQFPEKIKTEKI